MRFNTKQNVSPFEATVLDHFNGSGHDKKHLRKLAKNVELAILRLHLRLRVA